MLVRAVLALCVVASVSARAEAGEQALTLTLEEAVQRALVQNAEMAARAAKAVAAEAEATSAGRPPPLQLSLSPATIIEELEAAVVAVLDISGRRKWASRAARHELAAVLAGNEEFHLELVAGVKSTYWRLRVAQERLAVAQSGVTISEEVRRSADRLLQAGMGRRVDLDRAASGLDRARLTERQAAAAVRGAQTDLARLMYVPPESAIIATDALPVAAPSLPPGPDLQRLALETRPAMRKMSALVEAARARVGLARTERAPSFEVSLEREEEVNFGRALLELPLVDFGTIRHGTRAARADVQAAKQDAEVVQAEIRAEVQSAADALAAESVVVQRLRDDVLPRQADIVQRLQRGFERRAVSYADLLQAQAELNEVREQWLQTTTAWLEAQARLERAVGAPLEGMSNDVDDA